MKNDECTIYMTTKNGSTQIYRKDSKGWTQTSSKGIVRRMTAEQLLSHILPPLAGVSPAIVKVKRIRGIRKAKKKKSKRIV